MADGTPEVSNDGGGGGKQDAGQTTRAADVAPTNAVFAASGVHPHEGGTSAGAGGSTGSDGVENAGDGQPSEAEYAVRFVVVVAVVVVVVVVVVARTLACNEWPFHLFKIPSARSISCVPLATRVSQRARNFGINKRLELVGSDDRRGVDCRFTCIRGLHELVHLVRVSYGSSTGSFGCIPARA